MTELIKEIVFGGIAGFAAGYLSKKFGTHVVGGLAAGSFFFIRAAIFEGKLFSSWSPLAIDTGFQAHLHRKVSSRVLSIDQRCKMFITQNSIIASGFAGAYVLANLR